MRYKNSFEMKTIVIFVMMMIFTVALCGQAGTTQPLPPSNFGQTGAGTKANPYLIANLR